MSQIHSEEGNRINATADTPRWKGRNHFNFVVGRNTLRVLPVILHLLPQDIDWFAKDSSLFGELKSLLRDRVIAVTNDGDKDAAAPTTRKRARKEELCVQGQRLQFTYRYRKTLPRYTVLSYADDSGYSNRAEDSKETKARMTNSRNDRPGFRHFPLSDSTLLVWVYRYDADDPYRPVPNEAALRFAPTLAKQQTPSTSGASSQVLEFKSSGTGQPCDSQVTEDGHTSGLQTLGDPRDVGLLRWLWGWDAGDRGNVLQSRDGGGGVRQYFIGSASCQGMLDAKQRPGRRDQEEEDLRRAISLSLQEQGTRDARAGVS